MAKAHKLLPVIDPDYSEVRRILEALDDAGDEMSYSNYHNRLFGYAQVIIRDWCRQNKVRLGPTKKFLESKRIAQLQAENDARKAKEVLNEDGIPVWIAELLEKRKAV